MKTEIIQVMAGAAVLSAFTYLPILARDTLGADEFYITLIVSAYAVAAFTSSYIFGRAGDIYGRRIVLRVGLFLSMLSFGLLMIPMSLELLFLARVLNGFCIGMYPGALAAYAFESNMKMGRFASFGALGWGAGTVVAGYAAGFNIYWAFLVSAAFFVVAFGSAFTLPKIQVKSIRVPLFPVETFKRNYPVYLAVYIRHSSAFAVWVFWPLFLLDLGGDLFIIGLIQATNAIAQVIFMIGLTDRFDCSKLITVGLGASAATFAWISMATTVWDLFPSQVLLGFAWACLYVGSLKYVTERNVERSTASGLLQSSLSIAGVVGPIYAGILFALWASYIPIILFAALMSVVALIIFYFSNRGTECSIEGFQSIEILQN
ncbi:MAG: MFS transporter [Candidatus Thorarchaeota archaeon]|nr:MFS transporter [Candidatus Thorarchaeota archaeon]